ncbi:hypothetical protein [Rhizobium yanglingense]
MQKIVSSAAGISADRGDVVTVTAMDFLENQLLEDAAGGVRVLDMLSRNLAGIINSLAFLGVAFVVVWMGVRPLVRSISGGGAGVIGDTSSESVGLERPRFRTGRWSGCRRRADGRLRFGLRLRQHGGSAQPGRRRRKLQPPRQGRPGAEARANGRDQRGTRRENPQEMGSGQRRLNERPGDRPF